MSSPSLHNINKSYRPHFDTKIKSTLPTSIMCRGFQQNEKDRLKIRAFSAQLSASISDKANLPDSLTLHYLPRINGSLIEIDGSSIRPDSPAFVTLHRLWSEDGGGAAAYASRERVEVCEGVRFEIYAWDVKVLRGIFRRDELGERWRMECKVDDVVEGVKDAEVSVAAEGEAAVMREKVEMVQGLRRRRRRKQCCDLEEIPEERGEGSDACRCCECGGDPKGMGGGDGAMEDVEDLEMENVGWAVNMGIWAVCIGVGFLVSRASSKRFRRKRFV